MPPFRRAVVVGTAVLAVALALFEVAPARGHGCNVPVEIPLNKPQSVTIGVDNDGMSPVTSVDVEVPAGFDLDRALQNPPWTSTVDGRKITFAGGEVVLGTCGYFSLAGTARKKGVLRFPITTRAVDGTERRFAGDVTDPLPAQLVYAGVKAPQTSDVSDDGGSDTGPVVLGVAMTTVGLGGLGFMLWRSRQGPAGAAGRRRPPPKRQRPKQGSRNRGR